MNKLIGNIEQDFTEIYGEYFPHCEYEEIKSLQPTVECTITTIGFKIDIEIDPD